MKILLFTILAWIGTTAFNQTQNPKVSEKAKAYASQTCSCGQDAKLVKYYEMAKEKRTEANFKRYRKAYAQMQECAGTEEDTRALLKGFSSTEIAQFRKESLAQMQKDCPAVLNIMLGVE